MADSYAEWLRQDMGKMIDMLDLSELQKHYLNARWLDQVIWMEGKAVQSRDRYFTLRRFTIVGGAIVPALVGLNANQGRLIGDVSIGGVVYWLIFFISLMVAITAALEEFHGYSERWRHYRSIVEELKIVGWQYIQLSGPYVSFASHKEAYVTFVNKVEEIIQRDVEIYVSSVAAPTSRRNAQQQDEDQQQTTEVDRAPIFN